MPDQPREPSTAYSPPLQLRVWGVVVMMGACVVPAVVGSAAAQEGPGVVAQDATARRVFRQARPALCKLAVVDADSGDWDSRGSAFHVGDGLLVTNYHVITTALDDPDYLLEASCGEEGEPLPARVEGVDVVHDLATVRIPERPEKALRLARDTPARGDVAFALGNPLGLGLTIVEGTWGGEVAEGYGEILFSGGINHGMSGGPALDRKGAVVGVNVARRSGDDLGLLVPAEFLRGHLEEGGRNHETWAEEAATQLIDNQKSTIEGLLRSEWEAAGLSGAVSPLEIGEDFSCRTNKGPVSDDTLVAWSMRRCSNNRSISLRYGGRTGEIEYQVKVYESLAVDPVRFYGRYGAAYGTSLDSDHLSAIESSSYRCYDRFTRAASVYWKTAICSRPYDDLPGLYDLYLSSAALGDPKKGLLLQVAIRGVGRDAGLMFLQRMQESVRWE